MPRPLNLAMMGTTALREGMERDAVTRWSGEVDQKLAKAERVQGSKIDS